MKEEQSSNTVFQEQSMLSMAVNVPMHYKKHRICATQEKFFGPEVLRALPHRSASKVEGGACPTFSVILMDSW